MQLNPHTLKRLQEAQLRPEAIGTIFENIAKCVDQFGPAAAQLSLDYQHPDDPVSDGDLIPVIVLSVRAATKPIESK